MGISIQSLEYVSTAKQGTSDRHAERDIDAPLKRTHAHTFIHTHTRSHTYTNAQKPCLHIESKLELINTHTHPKCHYLLKEMPVYPQTEMREAHNWDHNWKQACLCGRGL